MKTLLNIICAFAIMVFSACEMEIDLELDTPNELLVVEGRIELSQLKPITHQQIKLSRVGDYLKNNGETPATEALVWVTDTQSNTYSFVEFEAGKYLADEFLAKFDETYTLNIEWNNNTYQAIEHLVRVAPIDSLYDVFEEESLFDDAGIKINIDFTDPSISEDYYFWETFTNGYLQILPDAGNRFNLIASDDIFNGLSIKGYNPNEELFFMQGDTVTVRQLGLSQNAFSYYFNLFDQAGKFGAPIDTPPIPVRGNVQNLTNTDDLVLGYFYASEVYEKTHIVK